MESCIDCKWFDPGAHIPVCRHRKEVIPNLAPCDNWAAARETPHPDTLRLEKLAKHLKSGAVRIHVDTEKVHKLVLPEWARGVKVVLAEGVDLRAYIDNLEE